MAEVRRSNEKAFEQLEVKLKELDGYEGKVGWFDTAKYPDGTPVAYIAAIQELGYGPIPPRLGMRETISKNQAAWKKTASVVSKRVLDGKMTGRDAMKTLAQQGEDDLADHISHVTSPPLSEITLVARKFRRMGRKVTGKTIGEIAARLHAGEKIDVSGISTKPLNDTGYLIASLKSVVEAVR